MENKLKKNSPISGLSISVRDCVTGTVLRCHPDRKDYNVLISKAISKMFFMHGKSFTQDMVFMYLESITETYGYETPETILLFLNKAARGDFGKFYGEPDIGTLREWFADFLQMSIIPERERVASQKGMEEAGRFRKYDNERGQIKRINEINKRPARFTKVTKEEEHDKGKIRKL